MKTWDERFLKDCKIEVYEVKDPAEDGLRERMWGAEAEVGRLLEELRRARRREFWWIVVCWAAAAEFVFISMVIMAMRGR